VLYGIWGQHLRDRYAMVRKADLFLPHQKVGRDNVEEVLEGESVQLVTGDDLLYLRLSHEALGRIGLALEVAANETEKELKSRMAGNHGMGFLPGDAFNNFLLSLRNWAKENKSPSTTKSHYGDPKFNQFAYQLNKIFQSRGELAEFADSLYSASAVEGRMKLLLRKIKKRQGSNTPS
jgi:hypothetical protein